MAPLGAFYAPAFAAGTRAGVAELAPLLLGADPREPGRIRRLLDHAMLGQPGVKSALDMAIHDLAARAAGVPLCTYLGGRYGTAVDLYRSVSQDTPGGDGAECSGLRRRRLPAHPGQGRRRAVARTSSGSPRCAPPCRPASCCSATPTAPGRPARRAHSCARRPISRSRWNSRACRTTTAAACAAHCPHPLVLDECIDSLPALLAAHRDGVADGVTIKIARVGGVGPAALLRDVAVELGLPVTVEDTGGSDIDTAAMAHLSLSTPEELRIHTVDFNAWVSVGNATGMPPAEAGRLRAPDGPGLGVEVQLEALGEPFGSWA